MSTSLVVVGLGYVGVPMAVRAGEAGLDVVGLDTSSAVVDGLNAGHSHIDDVSDVALGDALAHGFRATTDPACIADADVVVVCVPTPLSAPLTPLDRPVQQPGDVVRRRGPSTGCVGSPASGPVRPGSRRRRPGRHRL